MGVDYLILIGSVLILISIAIYKVSDNLGVPTLVLFLGIGMLAGSEGPGGIYFDDAALAQSIGVVALVFILFAGGLDTQWPQVRPVLFPALSLATLGVLLTALSVGLFVHWVVGVPFLNALLLGSVISSTDAAAVFSVLRARNVSLRGQVKPLLELESGSNDPMAVFLTVGCIDLLQTPEATLGRTAWLFIFQMGLGAAVGFALGKALVVLLNKLRFYYEGMYPVFVLASVGLIYGIAAALGGSGFLAVYLAGLLAGNGTFIQKKSLLRFFDGLAWLSQIGLFVTLGLLVFPSYLIPVLGQGLMVSAFLMLAARPLSVFASIALSRFNWREKAFISWVGLRGAVPIVLATFPLMADVPGGDTLFNLVFFIVLTSALLQGWSVPLAAKVFGVDAPLEPKRHCPIEFETIEGLDTELVELPVPSNSAVVGKSLVELGLPRDSLVVLMTRNDTFIVPSGGTTLEPGDCLQVLVNKDNLPTVKAILSRPKEE